MRPASRSDLRPRRAAVGHVPRVCADQLTGKPEAAYAGSVTCTKLKVSGIDVFSAGDFSGGEDCEDIVLRDAARGVYKRIVVKEDRIVGAVLYGDTDDGAWYFELLREARGHRRHSATP